jgi:hypothetical protein
VSGLGRHVVADGAPADVRAGGWLDWLMCACTLPVRCQFCAVLFEPFWHEAESPTPAGEPPSTSPVAIIKVASSRRASWTDPRRRGHVQNAYIPDPRSGRAGVGRFELETGEALSTVRAGAVGVLS